MIIWLQGYERCELAAQVIAFCLEVVLPSPAPFPPLTQFNILECDQNFSQCVLLPKWNMALIHMATGWSLKWVEKKIELMVYSREQIIDEVRAITKTESPDLCPALTQKWQRLSKLIRVCVGLRHVEAGCGLPTEKQKPAWKWFILGRKNITTSSEWMNQ